MNVKQLATQHSIERAIGFAKTRKKELPPSLLPLVTRLEAIHAVIVKLVQKQKTTRNGRTQTGINTPFLRKSLQKQIKRISKRGRRLLKGMPGINDSLRLPRSKAKIADLVKDSRRIVENVRPHVETFYAAGIERDFLSRAEQAIERLETHANRSNEVRSRSPVQQDLKDALREGREIIDDMDSTIECEMSQADFEFWHERKRIYLNPRGGPKPTKKTELSLRAKPKAKAKKARR